MVFLFLLPGCVIGQSLSYSQDYVVLSGELQRYDLSQSITYLEDPEHLFDIENVIEKYRAGHFMGGQSEAFNFGFTSSVYWFHITLENSTARNSEWVLEQWYQLIDQVDVYIYSADGNVGFQSAGDSVAFGGRSIAHFRPNFSLNLPVGEKVEIYFRAVSKGSFQMPLYLWERDAFLYKSQKEFSAFSVYYGVILAMIFYNVLLFVSIRDINYLYYVSYLAAYFLFQLILNGLAFQLLWPDSPWWNARALAFAMGVGMTPLLIFSRSFLRLKENTPMLDMFFKVLMLYLALSGILVFFVWNNYVVLNATVSSLLVSILSITAGVVCFVRGFRPAFYYLVSWVALLVGMIIYVLKGLGVLPINIFTEYAIQIGSALETILLSLALADRINDERGMRFKMQQQALITERELRYAQEHALEVERKSTESLELRVMERTRELEDAKKKFQELSATDQLTGLKNRRYFDQALDEEYCRCVRYKRELSILMIDIDYFKQLNDTYGHLVGDQCLKEVAKCVSRGARWPSDRSARYGGEEFCIVLPETGCAGAAIVAERIRKNIESLGLLIEGNVISVTVSIGVVSEVPTSNTPSDLLKKADEALYKAKKSGRNNVTLYSSESPGLVMPKK